MNTNNQLTIKSGTVLVFDTLDGTVTIKLRVKTFNAVTFKIDAPKTVKVHRAESYKAFNGEEQKDSG